MPPLILWLCSGLVLVGVSSWQQGVADGDASVPGPIPQGASRTLLLEGASAAAANQKSDWPRGTGPVMRRGPGKLGCVLENSRNSAHAVPMVEKNGAFWRREDCSTE